MKKVIFSLLVSLAFLSACNNDDDAAPSNGSLDLTLAGLEDLGSDFVYEGWVIVNGAPVSTGRFSVDANGALSNTQFDVANETLQNATQFVLTIEPTVDTDPAPSVVKMLEGPISNNAATVSAGIVGDFSASWGRFILATPTTSSTMDDLSGVWFLDNSSGSPVAGMSLPTLPEGWIYEGWAVVNGTALSTGRFSSVEGQDDAATFSGTDSAGPSYPGEDFINNAPAGLTFPTDLTEAPIVISIEPVPDNSAAPFTFKPLFGASPAGATPGTVYEMNNQAASFPSGSISITLN